MGEPAGPGGDEPLDGPDWLIALVRDVTTSNFLPARHLVELDRLQVEPLDRFLENLTTEQIARLAKKAVERGDARTLLGLATRERYAVARGVSMVTDGWDLLVHRLEGAPVELVTNLTFKLAGFAPEHLKRVFRRLAREAVLRQVSTLVGKRRGGQVRRRVPYQPGMPEFDLDETLARCALVEHPTHADVVGLLRVKKRRGGVLMLDMSASVRGTDRVNAALAAAVVANFFRDDQYGIVLFDYHARVLKGVKQERSVDEVVDALLNYRGSGCTDISAALEEGARQLKTVGVREKLAILVTDGAWNRGRNPLNAVSGLPPLLVVALPTQAAHQQSGADTCKQLAKATGGRYVWVRSHAQIPRVLADLLRRRA
ncbi:MAG: hypothetical protein Kow0069_15590 [Promethearchaeota archaeon]